MCSPETSVKIGSCLEKAFLDNLLGIGIMVVSKSAHLLVWCEGG